MLLNLLLLQGLMGLAKENHMMWLPTQLVPCLRPFFFDTLVMCMTSSAPMSPFSVCFHRWQRMPWISFLQMGHSSLLWYERFFPFWTPVFSFFFCWCSNSGLSDLTGSSFGSLTFLGLGLSCSFRFLSATFGADPTSSSSLPDGVHGT